MTGLRRPRVAAIVLAAGRASRYRAAGGREETKLVAPLDGEPLIRLAARAALGSRARPVVAVTGHARAAVERALADLPVEIVFNPDFASGLSSSLRAGLRALPPEVDAAIVLLGDMPRVTPALIDALIDSFAAHPLAEAAAPVSGGRRGNPVLLGKALFPAALALDGDEGARRLLAHLMPGALIEVETGDSAATFDVDAPQDLIAADNCGGKSSAPPED